MLSRIQERQHQKNAALALAPGRQPQPRGPVHLVHGPGFLRHEGLRPMRGPGFQRQALLRLVLAPEFLAHGAERAVHDPEFHPLEPQRQRQERRCAM